MVLVQICLGGWVLLCFFFMLFMTLMLWSSDAESNLPELYDLSAVTVKEPVDLGIKPRPCVCVCLKCFINQIK